MRSTIERVVTDIFKCNSNYLSSYYYHEEIPYLPHKYLNIPINSDSFEIPVFAFRRFVEEAGKYYKKEPAADTIAIELYNKRYLSSYKSPETIIRDVLNSKFKEDKLTPIKLNEMDYMYYGTQGALFDKDFNPIMICVWLVSRHIEEENIKFALEKPVIRIDTNTFIAKNDPINRLISGKFVNKALNLRFDSSLSILSPSIQAFKNVRGQRCVYPENNNISLIVEPIPFKLKSIKRPSIITNNEDLIKIISDNYQEIIDWSDVG